VACGACPFGKRETPPLDDVLEALSRCDHCELEEENAELVGLLREAGKVVRKTRNDFRRAVLEARELERAADEDRVHTEKLESLYRAASRELEAALAERDELVRRKSATLRALRSPILEVSTGVLAAPIIGVLDEERASELMTDLLEAVVSRAASAVALDLTGVDSLDAGTADHIASLCKAITLIGARVVVSGLRPDVVACIVASGVDLGALTTVRSLKDAIERARKR
jgi:rsbT co-antagonist protein RsbR